MTLFDINRGELCLIDSATTHTILRNKKHFSSLIMRETNVQTISGSINLIEGSGRANILLPGGTKLFIDNALYSTKSKRNLLGFKDIRRNGYHVETKTEGNQEYLDITNIVSGKKCIVEKLSSLSSGLYYTFISTIEINVVINQKFTNNDRFNVWHGRLSHLSRD